MAPSVRQVRDTAGVSATSGVRIPASYPDTREIRTINFTPVNARLVTSRNGFDEYTISANCHTLSGSASRADVLRAFEQHIKADLPAIGTSRSSGHVTPATEDSSDDEPLMNRVVERRAAANSQASDGRSAMVPHSQEQKRLDVPSHLSAKRPSKRTLSAPNPLARRPTPPRRGPSFRTLTPASGAKTPIRLKTPARSKTPARLSRKTPVPPTVRRRKMWAKTEASLPSYLARINKFSRRGTFTKPTTAGVSLARLETFWGILTDLITENEAFAGAKGWEHAIDVLQRVDDRMGGRALFGDEEGQSVLQELVQQRMLIVAGGKVMLTRNALSTRLS
ncbi:hypothetical protein N0V86_007563 [Didymella sp. IMI 355093]|nr:hypothetical protein N0V86_007563 [Didymella sp. IMI 355093]